MNQKLVKSLRRLAKAAATKPLVYIDGTNTKRTVEENPGFDADQPSSKDNMPIRIVETEVWGTRHCNPGSARAIYKQLKKEAKRAK